MENLRKFFEELEDDDTSISQFESPTKEEWEYADPDNVTLDTEALDIAADLLLDGYPDEAAAFFETIARVLREESGDDLEKNLIDALRQQSAEITRRNHGSDCVLRPNNNNGVIWSLGYLVDALMFLFNKPYHTTYRRTRH